MSMKEFVRLINYGSKAWRGFFTFSERKEMLHEYYSEYKKSILNKKLTYIMAVLCDILQEDGAEECLIWREKILKAIN